MKLKELQLTLTPMFEAGIVPFLWGETQIGKSEAMAQYCENNQRKLIDRRLAQLEPGDMLGSMYEEDGRTKWATPDWWPKEGERAVLFLDEFNRVKDPAMEASTFQLIRDRQLHTHVLPSDCDVIAAGNPTKGHKIQDMTDRALIARFCHLVIRPGTLEWLEYAASKSVHPDIRSFIAADDKNLDKAGEADIPIKAIPNRRGWMLLSRFMEISTKAALPEELKLEVASGLIGVEAAAAFKGWVNLGAEKPWSAEDVIKQPKKAAKAISEKKEEGRHDWIRAVVYNFIIDGIPEKEPEWGAAGVRGALDHIAAALPEDYTVLIARKLIGVEWTKRELRKFSSIINVLRDVFPEDAA